MHFMGFNDYQGDGDRNNGLAAVLSSLLFVGSAVLIYFLKLKDASHLAEAIVLWVIREYFSWQASFSSSTVWLRLREVPENPGIAVGTPSSIPILSPESWPSSSAWFSRSQPFSFGIPCIKAARTRWGSGFSVYSRSCFSFMRFPSYW